MKHTKKYLVLLVIAVMAVSGAAAQNGGLINNGGSGAMVNGGLVNGSGGIRLFNLDLQLNVPDARIFINNVLQNPGQIFLPAGSYDIRVLSDGYNEFSRNIYLDRNSSIRVNLQPRNSAVVFDIPREFRGRMVIHIDGREIDIHDANSLRREDIHYLNPGEHRVEFSFGWLSVVKTIDLQPDEVYRLTPAIEVNVEYMGQVHRETVYNSDR